MGTACRVAAEDEKERNAKVRGGRRLEEDLAAVDSIVSLRVELNWGNKLRQGRQ